MIIWKFYLGLCNRNEELIYLLLKNVNLEVFVFLINGFFGIYLWVEYKVVD